MVRLTARVSRASTRPGAATLNPESIRKRPCPTSTERGIGIRGGVAGVWAAARAGTRPVRSSRCRGMGANVAYEPYLSRPMHLNTADLVVITLSIIISFLPALFFWRRASKNTTEFFTSGRAAPWWLVGVSMVATTFSTDTPNLVTNFVRDQGVAQNWLWWSFLLTGMATVFFYAKMWRRSRVLTDLEFYEIRYSGKAASFVRGFRSIYLGLFFNCVIMAAVNLAAAKIASVVLGWPMKQTLIICAVLNVAFAATSGLWGVLVTDFIQFGFAMTGSFAAANFALKQPEVGGLTGLFQKIDTHVLNLLPDFGDWSMTLSVLIIPIAVQWWSVWYPGAEPGGGSYIAQRMLA